MVQFDPPLSCAVSVAVPPTLLRDSRLCLHATLLRDEHASLRRDGTKVQVWSDFGTGNWSETSFEEEDPTNGVQQQDDSEAAVDISLVGNGAGSDERIIASGSDMVSLVALTPLLPLVGRTIQFTYRLAYASGSVSWLGSMGTNGSISVETTREAGLRREDWREDAHGVFSWCAPANCAEPVVVAKLSEDANWRGWAIGNEGPSSFTVLSSAVTERVALALLPKTHSGAYVAYEPILYHTSGNATLSLTGDGQILFQPREEESVLHASLSTHLWPDVVSDKATTLDTRSPHFLGISVRQNTSGGRIHLLPMSGAKASITLTFADLNSLASHAADTLVLVDSTSRTAKFFAASSPNNVRVTVGPAGGYMFVFSGFVLRNKDDEWNVACFPRGDGHTVSLPVDVEHTVHSEKSCSSTEDATSESAATDERFEFKDFVEAPPESHPSTAIEAQVLLVMLYMLRLFLGLVSTTISLSSSPQVSGEPVAERPPVESQVNEITNSGLALEPQPMPRNSFEVTGKFTVVVEGDISKLVVSLDGTLLDSNPEDIGRGIWIVESDAGNGTKLLEVASHE